MRRRLGDLVRQVRSTRAGDLTVRIMVAVAGTVVILAGAILVPLPGPGWLIIFAGIGLWALEFAWAKRLLRFARHQVHRWDTWYRAQSWPVRIGVGALTLILVAGIVLASAVYTIGWDTFTPW